MENSFISTQDLKIVVESLENGNILMNDILSLVNKPEKKDEFILTIDYNRTLEEMILIGVYDKRDLLIGGNKIVIPQDLPGQKRFVRAKLLNFKAGTKIFSDYIIKEMAKEGYYPANLIELLSFGKDYRKMQKYTKIVALGSVFSFSGKPYSPVIDSKFSEERFLTSNLFNEEWTGRYKFLAVK